MKFLCPACERLCDIASFRVDAGALALTCSKCSVETREQVPSGRPSMPAPSPNSAAFAREVYGAADAQSAAPAALLAVPSAALDRSQQRATTTAPIAPSSASTTPGGAPLAGSLAQERAAGQGRPGETLGSASALDTGALAADTSAGRVAFLRAVTPNAAFPDSREDPFEVPDRFCPKCISLKRMNGPACASCGLVFLVFNPAEHEPPKPIADAWLTLTKAWEDNGAHERFLQLAVAQGALAAAGRLYRIQLAHNPDDPYAARGRDEVFRIAAAASPLNVAAAERKARAGLSRRVQVWLVGAAVIFLLIVLTIFLRSMASMGSG